MRSINLDQLRTFVEVVSEGNFSAAGRRLNLTPPAANRSLDLSFDVLNAGNVHIFPVARMAIIDSSRKLVAKSESEPKRLLPGQKDSMHVGWTGNLPAGDYTAVLTIAYGNDRIETQQLPLRVEGQ